MLTSLAKAIYRVFKGNNQRTLVAMNIMIILSVIFMPHFVNFGWSWVLGFVLVYFCNMCLGVSITYHRSLTHYALKMPKWLEHLFASFAGLSGTGSPFVWVMVHRQHHRFADRPGDPHPPQDVWKTFFGVYPAVNSHIKDIARDPFYRAWHRFYFIIHLAWTTLLFSVGGLNALFYLYVLPVALNVTMSNASNWFGHAKSVVSYRNYNLKDLSQNNPLMALFAFGEGFHNNHHRYPNSSQFGSRWFEFDASYVVVRALKAVGLATNVKTHPQL